MICVKQVDDIEVEVLLQPDNVAFCTMEDLWNVSISDTGLMSTPKYLHDVGICENLVELFQLLPQCKGVDHKVLCSGAYLHEAHEATETAIVVILEVHSDFLRNSELVEHCGKVLRG